MSLRPKHPLKQSQLQRALQSCRISSTKNFATTPTAPRLASHPSVPCFRSSCGTLSPITSKSVYRRASSSTRWTARQSRDAFTREARVQGLKSRAAFKLLQINEKYRLFKKGQTVVDLGYAPGSWSQVAISRTQPGGRVLGIDLIPAQPPKGVSTIQGNFLSPDVRADVKSFLRDSQRGRLRRASMVVTSEGEVIEREEQQDQHLGVTNVKEEPGESYIDRERRETAHDDIQEADMNDAMEDMKKDRMVDIVLSDMSAPWEQTSGFSKRSISDPYRRLMNTSGNNFRDHAGSMDLCRAALDFSFDVLKFGGHFVCKFYQGAEDKALELQLKKLFAKVHREKPESSRSESKESYFVAIRRLPNARKEDVFPAET